MVSHIDTPRKAVHDKIKDMRNMPPEDAMQRIQDYPDQERLNYDEDGKKRPYPIGHMAEPLKSAQPNDLRSSKTSAYYASIDTFAELTTPEERVVGTTFRNADVAALTEGKNQRVNGTESRYETEFRLSPEPDNPADANAIKVEAKRQDGEHEHIGYINREAAAAYELDEPVDVHGDIVDFSNGKLKNISYRVPFDTEHEHIHQRQQEQDLELSENDLMDLEEDGQQL